MRSKAYIGIDPSLRSSGICLICSAGVFTWAIETTPGSGAQSYSRIMNRTRAIIDEIVKKLGEYEDVAGIGIEDYAYSMAKNRGYSGTIEAGGIIKSVFSHCRDLFDGNQPELVQATKWKKTIYGKPTLAPKKSAPKSDYLNTMCRISGIRFETTDEADAWCIAETLRRRDSEAES